MRNAYRLEEGSHTLHLDDFSDPLSGLRVFIPPVPNLPDEFLHFGVRLFDLYERDNDPGKQRANNNRCLTSYADRGASFLARLESLCHLGDTMHAPATLGIVDLQFLAVIAHALGGTHIDDFSIDIHLRS